MKTTENIQKVSVIFFIIIGLAHIITGLMAANGYFPEPTSLISRVLEIPFIVIGMIYGFSSLKLIVASREKKHKILDTIFVSIVAVVFVAIVTINIFVPDIT